jgi:general stress protein 26
MNSINEQQPEDNKNSLRSKEAVAKIKELADTSKTCFLCTDIKTGKAFAARPMSVQEVDEQGNVWFLSASDSHQNEHINADPHVQLLFQGGHYSDFLNLYGKATISKDKARIQQLWNPLAKNWFTEGENDPRITVVKVTPDSGYYWDTKHGNVVSFAKSIVGAATGKTMDDSVEGNLKV